MNPLQLQYRSTLSAIAPKPKSVIGQVGRPVVASTLARPTSPASSNLWSENGIVWNLPASPQATPYPVAFVNLQGFATYVSKVFQALMSPLPESSYAPSPFSATDIPVYSETNPFTFETLSVACCRPSVVPHAYQALASIGVKTTGTVGTALPGLGPTCVATTATGTVSLSLQYLMLVPDPAAPADACIGYSSI